jgi:hypothetical protein
MIDRGEKMKKMKEKLARDDNMIETMRIYKQYHLQLPPKIDQCSTKRVPYEPKDVKQG